MIKIPSLQYIYTSDLEGVVQIVKYHGTGAYAESASVFINKKFIRIRVTHTAYLRTMIHFPSACVWW
jgi:hypothetical protein